MLALTLFTEIDCDNYFPWHFHQDYQVWYWDPTLWNISHIGDSYSTCFVHTTANGHGWENGMQPVSWTCIGHSNGQSNFSGVMFGVSNGIYDTQ